MITRVWGYIQRRCSARAFRVRYKRVFEWWTLALKRFENCFVPRQSESVPGRLIQKRFPSRKSWLCFFRGSLPRHAQLLLSLKRSHALQESRPSSSAVREKWGRNHPLFPLLQLPRSLCTSLGLSGELRGFQFATG